MSNVVEETGNKLGGAFKAVGKIANDIVDAAEKVVTQALTTVEKTVQAALDDPIVTIARIAAVATGQFELLPVINAASVISHGGSIEQAGTSAFLSYIAPSVGSTITSALADTAFSEAVASLSDTTGIASLPKDISTGLGTATTTTASNLLGGKTLAESLSSGITAGVGSGVGSAITQGADTGGEGTNTLDRLLGQTAGASTTAALRGQDITTAGANAFARGLVNTGFNEAGKEIKNGIASLNSDTQDNNAAPSVAPTVPAVAPVAKTAEAPVTATGIQLASNNVAPVSMTDTYVSPTDQAIAQLRGETPQTPESQATLDQLIKALYPEKVLESVVKVDTEGNAYDVDGKIVGTATELGLLAGEDAQGKPVWISQKGDVINAVTPSINTEEVKTPTSTTPTTTITGGDMPGDFPQKIENLPDGSTKVTEFDGSYSIFGVDGTVKQFDEDGIQKIIVTTKKEEEDPDPLGTFINNLPNINTPVLPIMPDEPPPEPPVVPPVIPVVPPTSTAVVIPPARPPTVTLPPATPPPATPPPVVTPRTPTSTSVVPALTAAALATHLFSNDTIKQQETPTGEPDAHSMYYDITDPYAVKNGRAYGQHFISPVYKAEGGLLSLAPASYMQPSQLQQPLGMPPPVGSQPQQAYGQQPYMQPDQNQYGQMPPQYIQPTIDGQNHLNLNQDYNADPTQSVNMFAGGGMPIAMSYGGLSSLQSHLGGYSDGGRMLKGQGDGMSDDIPASIDGRQPARLANEEFVIPADVVSHLGNGSSEAGAKVLYDMMARVRKARTGNQKQGRQINPDKFMSKMRG